MGDKLAQVEEAIRATEQVLAALGAENPEQLAFADKVCSEAFRKLCAAGPIDLEKIPDPKTRSALQDALRRLNELTVVCLQKAAEKKKSIADSFGRLRGARQAIESAREGIGPSVSEIDRDA